MPDWWKGTSPSSDAHHGFSLASGHRGGPSNASEDAACSVFVANPAFDILSVLNALEDLSRPQRWRFATVDRKLLVISSSDAGFANTFEDTGSDLSTACAGKGHAFSVT